MQRFTTALLLFVLLAAVLAWGQAPPAMPKPGPEHQRLHYFVGTWHSEGDMKASPMGPAGKVSSNDHGEMVGDFFCAIHSDGTTPMGPMKAVGIMGYDPKTKMYTYDGFDNSGMHDLAKGSVSGKTWTFTDENEIGGKKIKGRYTMTELSATSYTFKFDMSEDGKTWNNIMEGKATKTK